MLSTLTKDNLKFDDIEVKKQSVATRYRVEQEETAYQAIKSCPAKDCAVELYAGTGGLTSIYEKNFKQVFTNDLNKNVDTQFHTQAENFFAHFYINKIDLIDFDCYGCPALAIQRYFNIRKNLDAPFVLRFSDGLGLYLKRNKNEKVVRDRYLIKGPIVMEKIWLRHSELIDYFLKKIAGQYGMKAEKIIAMQTRYKNYVLGAYKFTLL